MSGENTRETVKKILAFLTHQIETNSNLTEPAKESLTVALECIEQAFGVAKQSASRELLDICAKASASSSTTNASSNTESTASSTTNPAAFIQNLATSILTQASQQPAASARVRKTATPAEKLAAESFKNQGNDFMKQDKFKEAYDCYTQAINIDDNNAIYYSNRAAASSRLGDNQAVLRDCQEAIEIDPNYSKAHSRMGLAYATLGNHQKARESYLRAVELDPNNESIKHNLRVSEDYIAESANSSTNANANTNAQPSANNQTLDMMSMLRSMMGNPDVMQAVMGSLQDPRMQSLLGLGSGANQGTTGTSSGSSSQQQQQQQQPGQEQAQTSSPIDLLGLASRLGSGAAVGNDLIGAGQQLLSTMEQSNPNLVNDMRRMLSQAFTPPNSNPNPQNPTDQSPPPGYS